MRNLLRLLRLAIPLWRWVLLGLLLSLATTLAHIGLLALSSWFITSMAMAGSVGAVMNYFTPSAGVRALAIARAGGRYAERFVNHDTTFRMLAALRVWFFRRIEPLAPAGLTLRRSGDLLSRIRADIDLLDDFYVRGVVPSSVAVLSAACLVPFLLHFDPTLAWMDLGGLACAGVLLPLLLGTLAREPGRQRVAWAAELRSCMVEQIQGMAELEALGATGFQAARVDGAARRMEQGQRRINSLQGMAEAEITSIGSLAIWAAMFVLAPMVADGRLPGPDMAMLAVVVLASFETVMPLPGVLQRFGEMTAAAARLFEIIDEKPLVTEPAFPPGGQTGTPRTLDVSVRDLWFRYSPELPWIHRGLFFEMPAGSRLAGRRSDRSREEHPRVDPPEVLGIRGRQHHHPGARLRVVRGARAAVTLLRGGAAPLLRGPAIPAPFPFFGSGEPPDREGRSEGRRAVVGPRVGNSR